MKFVIWDDQLVANWVGAELNIHDFGKCTAIGISNNDNQLIAGVVYNTFDPHHRRVEMTIYTTSPQWCSRKVLKLLFWYPFIQLGCERVTACTETQNRAARAFLDRVGFRQEGILRQWFYPNDAAVYRMLRSECRWIGESK